VHIKRNQKPGLGNEKEILMIKYTQLLGLSAGLVLMAPAAMADSIDPTTFSAELDVGESVTIEKRVVVSEAATSALIDVHFLFDTSGSMGPRINGVKAAAADIFAGLDAFGDVAASVGVYSEAARLAPDGSVPGRVINQDLTTNSATAIAALNAVDLGDPDFGGDGPENGVNGVELSTENLSWRPGSNRFMFAFGDIGFKTSDITEAGGTSGLTFDTADNVDFDPISTAANATAALGANSVELFGFGPTGSFAQAIGTLGGEFILSGTDPDDIVADILAGITGSFAEYSTVTVGDLGGGLPEIAVSAICTGAGIGSCVGADAVGDYDRSEERTFTFDVTFERLAAGNSDFSTFALVDGGIVATESDSFPGGGDDISSIPLPAAGWLLLGGLAGLGAVSRRRKKAA
jgi:hypothetical protein